MKQATLDLQLSLKKIHKREFLTQMVPWRALVASIAPYTRKDVAKNNFPISDHNAVLPNGWRADAQRVRKIQG